MVDIFKTEQTFEVAVRETVESFGVKWDDHLSLEENILEGYSRTRGFFWRAKKVLHLTSPRQDLLLLQTAIKYWYGQKIYLDTIPEYNIYLRFLTEVKHKCTDKHILKDPYIWAIYICFVLYNKVDTNVLKDNQKIIW